MTTFSTSVSTSADDGDESGGTVDLTGANLNANSSSQYMAFRFNNVTIPAGSTINTASLALVFYSGSYDDPDVTIYCHDTDDAAALTTSSNDISGRTATTATTTWTASNVGTGSQNTPDFAAAVQEVIDRGGWSSGNDLVVILKGNGSSSKIRVRAYDNGTSEQATINIDYTAGGGGGSTQPPRTMHQKHMRQS